MNGDRLGELVRGGDVEELLLEVDRLADAANWEELLVLRDRCEAALEYGRQLWGVSQFIEYRVALDGPARLAAGVCRAGAARFALGPLTEVVAQRHTWEELADHLTDPWTAATVAQERVLRGEDLRGDPRAHPDELGLPLVLQPWEPDYPLPRYRSHDLLENGPQPVGTGFEASAGAPAPAADLPVLRRSLLEIAAAWSEHSNGAVRVVTVRGSAQDAVLTLFGDGGAGAVAPGHAAVEPAAALARLAWAAASGGAYGRRSGMAAGRSAAFWILEAALDLIHPPSVEDLGERVDQLGWYVLEGDGQGWCVRLALEHPGAGWAAALDAWDEEEDPW